MDPKAFLASSVADHTPPLRALWHDGHGDWQAAHEEAQKQEDGESAWVHAYLHRKEGDPWNAEYWYRRAGKAVHTGSTTEEWTEIVHRLLQDRVSGKW